MYDKKRLLQDTDMRKLIRYLVRSGVLRENEVLENGETMFVKCPEGHNETRYNHCAVYETGIKCFSCQASYGRLSSPSNQGGAIEVVQKYAACNFREAISIIADATGQPENYMIDGSKMEIKSKFPYTIEQLRCCMIHLPISQLEELPLPLLEELILERARVVAEHYRGLLQNESNPYLREDWTRRLRVCEELLEEQVAVPLFKL